MFARMNHDCSNVPTQLEATKERGERREGVEVGEDREVKAKAKSISLFM